MLLQTGTVIYGMQEREIFSGVLAGVGKNKRVSDDGVSGARGGEIKLFHVKHLW